MSIFIRSFQQHFDPFSPVVYHHDIKCVNIEGLSVPKFLRPVAGKSIQILEINSIEIVIQKV